ncbi:RHS repeat-associated core domain-containing protein [Knoellia locipacati]|uniref:RHS repeat-associated core domain-containing protein n=1 Tax=Knoellia locipacati TaxID=882824 RepID=UPI0038512BC5
MGDLCWDKEHYRLVMDGQSSELVEDTAAVGAPAGSRVFRTRQDRGLRLELAASGSNVYGDNNGEYWRVYETDGTLNVFGRGFVQYAGQAAEATNSVWTVPVFGDDAGEPCHQSTLAASWCQQAWRWNLDSVLDRHNAQTAYVYANEVNHYRLRGASDVVYDRGGFLTRVDYSSRFASAGAEAARSRTVFTFEPRCSQRATGAIVGATPSCPSFAAANASSYPDVPMDLLCTSGCTQESPSFFSHYLMRSVTSYTRTGGSFAPVDKVEYAYSYPDPGDGSSPSLWLAKIRRSGVNGSSALALPDVTLTGQARPNRVDYDTSAGVAPLNKYRVVYIGDELGGEVEVTYGQPAGQTCTAANIPSVWDTNTLACFPRYWVPEFGPAGFGAFHKYVTTKVVRDNRFPVGADDTATGSADQVTDYFYGGTPGWHHDDSPTAPASTQSWAGWRGYELVTVATRTDSAYRGSTVRIARTNHLFYRGMHGDKLINGTRTESITDSAGTEVTDWGYLSGLERETRRLNLTASGADSSEDSGTLTGYTTARTPVKANPSGSVDPVHDSYMIKPSAVVQRQRTVDGGVVGSRTLTTSYMYTSLGQTRTESSTGAGDPRCATYTYAGDAAATARNKLDYVAQVDTRTGSGCSTGAFLSRQQTYYDNEVVLTGRPIGAGNPTKTLTGKDTDTAGTTITSTVSTTATYDIYGRVLTSTDGNSNTTSTTYSAVTATPQTVTVSNPLNQTLTTTLDARRLTPAMVLDANGNTTSTITDLLGRVVKGLLPGDTAATASHTFTYTLDPAKASPAKITSSRRQPGGTYVSSTTFLDALGQPRQTQTVAPTSPYEGQDVTQLVNLRYDEAGRVETQSQPVAAFGTAGTAMLTFPMTAFNETRTVYDSISRPTIARFYGRDVLQWQTATAYHGSHTVTTPPADGGVPSTTTVDILGRVTAHTEGSGATTATIGTDYDAADRPITFTDAAGHQATYTYNLLGARTRTDDPDTGVTTTTYDNNNNPVTATRASGASTTTTYDDLNRVTQVTGKTTPAATPVTLQTQTYDSTTVTGGIGRPASTTITDPATGSYTQAVTGYTTHGLPTGTTYTFPALGGKTTPTTFTVGVGYDAADRPATLTYPAAGALPAETVTTGYTPLGLPSTLIGTTAYVSATTYHGHGALASRTLAAAPSPITRSYTWDGPTQRLGAVSTTIGATTAQHDTYTWADASQLRTLTDTTTPTPVTTCHSYDPLNRLTHAWTTTATPCTDTDTTTAAGPAGYNTSWTYTPDGNTTSVRRGATTSTYAYTDPAHPHAATTAGTANLTYDPDGHTNTTTKAGSTTTHDWDLFGHLTSTTTGTNTTRTSHAPDGTRLSRTTPDGTATLYLPGQEIDVNNGAITAVRRYYTINGTTVAVRVATPTSNTLTWQTNDRQGSVDLQIPNGTTTPNRTYTDPYGQPRTGTTAPVTDRGWLGKTTDPTTNLTHLGARYYDTTTQRFLSPDPLNDQATTQTPNPYTYGANNPLTYSDPSGLRNCADSCQSGDAWQPSTGGPVHTPGPAHTPNTQPRPPAATPPPCISQCGDGGGGKPAPPTSVHPHPDTLIAAGHALSGPGVVASPVWADFGADLSGECAVGQPQSTGCQVLWTGIGFLPIPGVGAKNLLAALQWASKIAKAAKPTTKAAKSADEFVDLASASRRTHILDGDATGGGHLWPGLPGKTPFPKDWSGNRVMHEISDVATDPNSIFRPGRGGSTIATGTRGGVDMKVVLRGGQIITGHPTNLPRNPW